jgi:4-amino-4-deoxy-L-arabinose transferase-like glycosyltransferase
MSSIASRLDRTAIGFSALCLVHCLLLPIALAVLPSMSIFATLSDETFHRALVILVLPTSLIALTLGCKRHKSLLVAALGAAGLIVLVLTALFGHHWLGETGERVATVFGACLVAAGHMQNFRLCQKQECSA